jgi:hypothetical protein
MNSPGQPRRNSRRCDLGRNRHRRPPIRIGRCRLGVTVHGSAYASTVSMATTATYCLPFLP